MTEKQSYLGDVRSAKLAISQSNGLAMLPAVAVETFEQIGAAGFSPVALTDIVKMSPALAVKVLSLAHSQGLRAADHHFSFSQILERMPADALRNAILATELWDEADQEDVDKLS